MTKNKELTYEQAFSRLEEITEKMSSASVPLDKLMKLYEEGMELAAYCDSLLKSYEARLEKVSKEAVIKEMACEDGDETAVEGEND